MDHQLQLDVGGIAKDDCCAELCVDDPGVIDTALVEVTRPNLELISVANLEGEVVETHATLVEAFVSSLAMRHDVHGDARGMPHRVHLEPLLRSARHEAKAENTLIPSSGGCTVGDGQLDMRDAHKMRSSHVSDLHQ